MAKKAKKAKPKPKMAHKAKSKPHKAAPKLHKAKAKAKVSHVKHSKAISKPSRAPAMPVREEHRLPVPMPASMASSASVVLVPQGSPIPPMQMDRVHLQNISFEIASMRRTLEKMLKQLDEVEKTVSERKESLE
jgi:hypothetical protein